MGWVRSKPISIVPITIPSPDSFFPSGSITVSFAFLTFVISEERSLVVLHNRPASILSTLRSSESLESCEHVERTTCLLPQERRIFPPQRVIASLLSHFIIVGIILSCCLSLFFLISCFLRTSFSLLLASSFFNTLLRVCAFTSFLSHGDIFP